MMYRVGGSSGGTDIIGAIINKHYSIGIGTTGFMFNIILMFIGVFLLWFRGSALYSACLLRYV